MRLIFAKHLEIKYIFNSNYGGNLFFVIRRPINGMGSERRQKIKIFLGHRSYYFFYVCKNEYSN